MTFLQTPPLFPLSSISRLVSASPADRVDATSDAGPADAANQLRLARQAEGARYALLRRLAPAIRHDMAGALQPISMVAAMLEKRLQNPAPDLAAMAKNVHAVNALTREASLSCMQLMNWLSPKVDEATPVHTGIAEAIALVTTDLSFKGFTLVNQTDAADTTAAVRVNVLRGLFMAALLTMADSHSGSARMLLGADVQNNKLILSITLEPSEDETMIAMPPSYRSLDWDDVQALAAAESAVLVRAHCRVELHCVLGALG